MGLDAYMYRKISLGKNNVKVVEKKGEKSGVDCGKINAIICRKSDEFDTENTVRHQVAYWRKFNALHKYMVDHFGDEFQDNCRDMYLGIEDLKELEKELTDLLSKIKKGEGWVNIGEGYASGKENKEVELEGGEKKLVKDLKVGDLLALGDYKCGEGEKRQKRVAKVDEPKEGFVRYVYVEEMLGEKVLNEDLCEEVFPTEEGFFFGSTDYDMFYIRSVADLIAELDMIIADHEELVASGVKEFDIQYVYNAWY